MIKKVFKGIGILLLLVVLLITGLVVYFYFNQTGKIDTAMEIAGPPAERIIVDGERFRDLNKNGELDPYEDRRLAVEERVEDLLAQMTVEEKAGLMFHSPAAVGAD